MKIGIVGHGFVGKAVDYGFPDQQCKKYIVDPRGGMSIEELPRGIDFTFVCVPTPMGPGGKIDSTIIEDVVKYLTVNMQGIIVIKSTVTPDIISSLTKGSPRIVYNPEFLTEKSANEDFVNPFMHVLGGEIQATKRVEELYKYHSICKPCPTYHMSAVDASYVKYGINSYLATKVLWFNQFYDVVSAGDGNFGKIVGAITSDGRVGRSHTTVPGFDGKRGFGGACFPKDTAAFLQYSIDKNSTFTVLKEVIERNNFLRRAYMKDEREIEQNVQYGSD